MPAGLIIRATRAAGVIRELIGRPIMPVRAR
jgi:hypothetical protein